MTFDDLERRGVVARIPIDPETIWDHMDLADRDVEAAKSQPDPDWKFNIAYNAVLQVCIAFLYANGYRPRSSTGKHQATIEAVADALGPQFLKDCARLESARRKRNRAVYQAVGTIGMQEAERMVSFAERITAELKSRIKALLPEEEGPLPAP